MQRGRPAETRARARQAWRRYVPMSTWLPALRRADIGPDVAAGLTTAVMLVPQAMAYALLAGLPPVVGLYASMAPLVAYAVFGTSRQLAVGPAAMVSLLVAAGVGSVASPETYVALAVVTALLVGVLQVAMGALRLGFLVNFLSQPVISGFTSAAALLIGVGQLKHLLGVSVPRGAHVHSTARHLWTQLDAVHGPTLALGLAATVALVALKRWAPRFPRALATVVAATAAVWWLDLAGQGVAVLGEVPGGLPALALPEVTWGRVVALAPTAATIALVGFVQSVSVAKAFARRHGYGVEPNQELLGLGMANLAGAAFGAFPVTGGFARTAVNDQAGARTGLAGLVTAAVVAVALLLFTPLLRHLPVVALAAIIVTAVAGLFDLAEARRLWRVDRRDFTMLTLTFAATLALGIEQGIAVGVVASALWFVVESTRPHAAVLGRLPGTALWRNVRRFPESVQEPGVLVVRVDAPLFYGNVTFLRGTVERLIDRRPGTAALVLDCSTVHGLDSSAAGALEVLDRELESRGIHTYFASVRGPVRDVLDKTQLTTRLDCGHLSVESAVATASASLGAEGTPCPPVPDGHATAA